MAILVRVQIRAAYLRVVVESPVFSFLFLCRWIIGLFFCTLAAQVHLQFRGVVVLRQITSIDGQTRVVGHLRHDNERSCFSQNLLYADCAAKTINK